MSMFINTVANTRYHFCNDCSLPPTSLSTKINQHCSQRSHFARRSSEYHIGIMRRLTHQYHPSIGQISIAKCTFYTSCAERPAQEQSSRRLCTALLALLFIARVCKVLQGIIEKLKSLIMLRWCSWQISA